MKRSIYIWRLQSIIDAEGGIPKIVDKARRAGLSALWIKIADGEKKFANTTGRTGNDFKDLINRCNDRKIDVWGWHVPHCPDMTTAGAEVSLVTDIAGDFDLSGIIMDAEGGAKFFQGGISEAAAYAQAMRLAANEIGIPLAISSNDIPKNIENWLPKFNKIAAVADFNFPQVYYGGSPSVLNRLTRAEDANKHVIAPFIPVGAAWIGDEGGCSSASACAERAREFMRLAKSHGYEGYSFWHWAGAPSAFWEVLNTTNP